MQRTFEWMQKSNLKEQLENKIAIDFCLLLLLLSILLFLSLSLPIQRVTGFENEQLICTTKVPRG